VNKKKVQLRKFKNPGEQEKSDIKIYRRMSYEKKLNELEELRKFYIIMKYGNIPRLKRICRVTKRK